MRISNRVTSNGFRRMYATRLYVEAKNLRLVQMALGPFDQGRESRDGGLSR